MADPQLIASRERVSKFAGTGCLIQGAGLVAPFLLGVLAGTSGAIIGVVLLVILFFIGSSKALMWRCGYCKNPIADAGVRICPVCKAELR